MGRQPGERNSEGGGTVPCREIPWLLSARRILPLVIARNGNQTACALEGLSKECLRGHRFGPGVEGSQLYVFERFAPPPRDQAPPHGNEGTPTLLGNNRINGVRGTDVVARPQIVRRRVER